MKKISCNDDLVAELRERYFAEPVPDGQEKVLELRKTRVPGDKQFEVSYQKMLSLEEQLSAATNLTDANASINRLNALFDWYVESLCPATHARHSFTATSLKSSVANCEDVRYHNSAVPMRFGTYHAECESCHNLYRRLE
jgi:hypothetical protein